MTQTPLQKKLGQIIGAEPIKSVGRWYGFSAYKAGNWSGTAIVQWVGYSDVDFDPDAVAEDEWNDISEAVLTANGAVDFPSRPGMLRLKPGFDPTVEFRIFGGTGS